MTIILFLSKEKGFCLFNMMLTPFQDYFTQGGQRMSQSHDFFHKALTHLVDTGIACMPCIHRRAKWLPHPHIVNKMCLNNMPKLTLTYFNIIKVIG